MFWRKKFNQNARIVGFGFEWNQLNILFLSWFGRTSLSTMFIISPIISILLSDLIAHTNFLFTNYVGIYMHIQNIIRLVRLSNSKLETQTWCDYQKGFELKFVSTHDFKAINSNYMSPPTNERSNWRRLERSVLQGVMMAHRQPHTYLVRKAYPARKNEETAAWQSGN